MTTPALAVGIDIGGTGTRFVSLDAGTAEVRASVARPTPAHHEPQEAAQFLAAGIDAVRGGGRVGTLGVGASGPIDADGVVRNPDTLPAFTGLPLLTLLSRHSEQAPVIDNDAVCAALGERAAGAAVGVERLLHVTLGTGIGVCYLQAGAPFRLADGSHPEAGHLSVSAAPRPCYCGRVSCWEQAASRQVLQRAAAGVLGTAQDDRSAVARLAARAEDHDPVALEVFRGYARAIADGLANLVTAYGPEVVVLGGTGALVFDHFSPTLTDALCRLTPWVPAVRVLPSQLDDFGGAIGAAHLGLSARGSAGAVRRAPSDSTRDARETCAQHAR